MSKLTHGERNKVKHLLRRATWLRGLSIEPGRTDTSRGWVLAELAALRWAMHELRKAKSGFDEEIERKISQVWPLGTDVKEKFQCAFLGP